MGVPLMKVFSQDCNVGLFSIAIKFRGLDGHTLNGLYLSYEDAEAAVKKRSGSRDEQVWIVQVVGEFKPTVSYVEVHPSE